MRSSTLKTENISKGIICNFRGVTHEIFHAYRAFSAHDPLDGPFKTPRIPAELFLPKIKERFQTIQNVPEMISHFVSTMLEVCYPLLERVRFGQNLRWNTLVPREVSNRWCVRTDELRGREAVAWPISGLPLLIVIVVPGLLQPGITGKWRDVKHTTLPGTFMGQIQTNASLGISAVATRNSRILLRVAE